MQQSPGRESEVWKTPLYEQYWRLKDQAPRCLLFFRLGDFYELFGDDALIAAPLLEVQLTSRDKSSAQPIPMCGVPAHAVDSYAEKLLSRGHHVALAEQTSPPDGKAKLVERKIVRILTPGLPIDYGRLDAKSPHWFLALGKVAGTARVDAYAYDFLGGELFAGELDTPESLRDLVDKLRPRETLVPAAWVGAKNEASPWTHVLETAGLAEKLTPWAGDSARTNLEDYLIYTQRIAREELSSSLPDAKGLARLGGAASDDYAALPANVFEHWAVFPELFELLDGAGSAVGSRRLRTILSSPLRSVKRLRARQAAFEAIRDSGPVLAASREVYDFERILGRFRVGAAAPRELLRLILSLRAMENCFASSPVDAPAWRQLIQDEALGDLADLRGKLAPLREKLDRALSSELDATRATQLSELIRDGFDAEFDRLRELQNSGEAWLASFEEGLRTRTGISSLKVRYNRVFGHYIEVTKTHLDKVPADFERKQTTVGGERFTCAELRAKESEILTAGARAENKARDLLESLQDEILSVDTDLKALVAHFSWIDAVAGARDSIRRLSRFGPWAVPTLEEGSFRFTIREIRHPIIESLTGNFVPNSLELGGAAKNRLLVLTGPNMAGKSTLMRSLGLGLLLAQCGFAVPAESMSFAPCSGFYSRMGATDRILAGESTFMVEMKETAAILRSADRESFILLDEIGRGTSTQDGLAIARAVLEHLHDELGAICLFATHYHELSEIAETLPQALNGSMSLREWQGDLVFLRTLELKPAESSHGIFVARMAGLPKNLLGKAQNYFLDLHREPATPSAAAPAASVRRKSTAASKQLSFLLDPEPTVPVPAALDAEERARLDKARQLTEELRRLDLENLTPKQAWLALESLKEQA